MGEKKERKGKKGMATQGFFFSRRELIRSFLLELFTDCGMLVQSRAGPVDASSSFNSITLTVEKKEW